MKKAKFSNGVQGKGFAAALALSVCAVGIATYAAYSGAVRTSTADRDDAAKVYDDNVFIFTSENAATVNAEKFDVPKDSADGTEPAETADTTQTADTAEAAAAEALSDGAGLFFKSPKTCPVANSSVINPYSGGELVKSETLGVWKTHDGVDYAAETGTAVSAMMKGTVTEVKNDPLWGISVTIDHGDGVVGYYCGLAENVSVKAGQEVSMGEVIGQVGNTADIECKLPPHLHFGVTVGGAWTDPENFINS